MAAVRYSVEEHFARVKPVFDPLVGRKNEQNGQGHQSSVPGLR